MHVDVLYITRYFVFSNVRSSVARDFFSIIQINIEELVSMSTSIQI